jgi:hypothetical protein
VGALVEGAAVGEKVGKTDGDSEGEVVGRVDGVDVGM